MKTSYYVGAGASVDVNFRFVGPPVIKNARTLEFDGYHTQNSTEYKATFELDFDEALDLIDRLKAAVASMPCPTCKRI